MNDWLKQNTWALLIACVTMVSTWTLYGARIAALEDEVSQNTAAISKINDTSVQTQVDIAKIQTDIEYIKLQINKLVK